ncbi:class I SAM-dependent methyltransferase [Pseudodesulfovibrio cashew]|uniref:class I SAM-dependent methyltransferase n=1 Tax=Pseudodesulfovibrio cashew TaxID=2678688 RepID=UPI0024110B59|nr:class I SAM-dependent methyltransferase [Pseudodesulfovibrio cashew]
MDLFSAHVPRDARILDFGCGYGRSLVQLRDSGFTDLTGIDFSEPLVRRGLADNPDLNMTAYEGGPLPYEANAFDAALMLGVFTCIIETRKQAQALIELKRVLRPGGYLYVTDFLLNRDKRNLDRYRIGQEKHSIYGIFETSDGGVMRHHDRNHMEALFFDFETLAFEEAVFETMHGHQSQGFIAMLRMPE